LFQALGSTMKREAVTAGEASELQGEQEEPAEKEVLA
jgi:hypothetical protein